MDRNDLLGLRATFDRVAQSLDRDGLNAHALERVMAWGPVVFGRQLTQGAQPSDDPFCTVKVRGWSHGSLTIIDRNGHPAELLARVLRDLSYTALQEMHGFTKDLLDPALEIAERPEKYSERIVRSARVTLDATARYSRDADELDTARALLRKLNAYLGDQP